MKCTDCIHQSVCGKLIWCEKDGSVVCEDFKNKSDFVEVVRCKDCERYREDCGICMLHFSGVDDDAFCSYGSREGEELE